MIAAKTSPIPTPARAAPDTTGWTCPSRACSARATSDWSSPGRPRPVDVRAQQPVVPRRDGVEHLLDRHRPRHRPGECDDGAGQLLAEGVQSALEPGPGPVQLVGEDQEGQPEPLAGSGSAPGSGPGRPRPPRPRARRRRGPPAHARPRPRSRSGRSVDQVHLHRPARGRQIIVATAVRMVMPRRRSIESESVVVSPWSTSTEVPGGPGLVEKSFGEGGLAGVERAPGSPG